MGFKKHFILISFRYNSCSSCNANVPTGCFGKHLVSHFHHYHLKSRELHNELILEHIHEIVKQAPFQCHICMFYCNFEEQFIQHWKSKHISKMCSGDTNENVGYWCSACRIIRSVPCLLSYPHCYFTRLNLKKNGPSSVLPSNLLGSHRNPKQKRFFLNSCEGFLMAALTGQGHPSPSWKIAKMALFYQWMKFEIFLDKMTSFEVL